MPSAQHAKLEDLKTGASIQGLIPGGAAKIVGVEWFGDQAVKVIFEDSDGGVQNRLVYRDEEQSLNKDRGKEPAREPVQYPWFWQNGKFTGARINDVHITHAGSRAARARAKEKI